MRWALVKVCLAVTSMVVIAFAVPLGPVVKEMARDRAFSNAEREAAAVARALSVTSDRGHLERVVASAASDADMAVHVPPPTAPNASTSGAGTPPTGTSRPYGDWAAPPPPRWPKGPRCCNRSR